MNAFPPFRLAVHRQWKRHWFTAVCSTWTSWLSLIAGTNFANYLSIPVYSCLVLKSTTTKNDPPKWRDFFFFFAQTRNESHPSLVPIRCCAIGACRVWTCPSHRFTTPTFFFLFFSSLPSHSPTPPPQKKKKKEKKITKNKWRNWRSSTRDEIIMKKCKQEKKKKKKRKKSYWQRWMFKLRVKQPHRHTHNW